MPLLAPVTKATNLRPVVAISFLFFLYPWHVQYGMPSEQTWYTVNQPVVKLSNSTRRITLIFTTQCLQ